VTRQKKFIMPSREEVGRQWLAQDLQQLIDKTGRNLSCGTVAAQTGHNFGHNFERGENSR